MADLPLPLAILAQSGWHAWFAMFWFMILLEVPRYMLSALAVFVSSLLRRRPPTPRERIYLDTLKLSVVVAGHNEADAMQRCLRSLGEQTRRIDEIIVVNDGSTDGMREMINALSRAGKIDMALSNQVRCGKSASCNMGFNLSRGDIIINLDADSSYDRDAIEKLIEPFADPAVGATTGAIGVRNFGHSAVTAWQTIEYLCSIALGKRVLEMFNIVACASGAFGAFRREAVEQIGIMRSGPGEDFDMTMRLRRAGWKIRFAGDSWCFTDVPETLAALVRQRRRWDRDTIRIRMRRFRDALHPGSRRFNWLEGFEQIDFLVLNLLLTVLFPFYVLYMFVTYGGFALSILVMVQLVYIGIDIIYFCVALKVANRLQKNVVMTVAPYVLTFSLFNGIFMRLVRLYSYYEEWVHRRSYQDSYSPSRVANQSLIE